MYSRSGHEEVNILTPPQKLNASKKVRLSRTLSQALSIADVFLCDPPFHLTYDISMHVDAIRHQDSNCI
jgi:hypothetical protein